MSLFDPMGQGERSESRGEGSGLLRSDDQDTVTLRTRERLLRVISGRSRRFRVVAVSTGSILFILLSVTGLLVMTEEGRVTVEGKVVGLMTSPSRKVVDGFFPLSSGGCAGSGEFKGVRAGGLISVLNSKRQLIGSGQLSDSIIVGSSCQFSFKVDGVLKNKVYRVSVAGRMPLSWTAAEVGSPGGIRIVLGV